MNQKKCKALRKAIHNFGCPKAILVMEYTRATHKVLEGDDIVYPLPLTFKYGVGSFQRYYRDSKSGRFRITKSLSPL